MRGYKRTLYMRMQYQLVILLSNRLNGTKLFLSTRALCLDRVSCEADPETGMFNYLVTPDLMTKFEEFHAAARSGLETDVERNAYRNCQDMIRGYPKNSMLTLARTDYSSMSAHKQKCEACGSPGATKKLMACRACHIAFYCSKECQVADWKRHKPACKKVAK